MADTYDIRPMSRADLDLAVDWAAAEGWNPGLHDAACFHGVDPGGFLGGFLGGEMAASISVVAYDDHFAFLGLYIVRPDLRGRGFGWRLWRAAMERLGERVVGLDGVVAQQDNYRKSGFALAWRNIRYEGRGGGTAPAGLVSLDTVPLAELAAWDRALFPAERRGFLGCWISRPGTHALAAMAGGRLVGYGVLRPCRTGWKVGPLFADDAATARRLFAGLAARVPGEPVFLDVPQPNPAAVALADDHGMRPCFETARMYRGTAPALALERVFGITTFELG